MKNIKNLTVQQWIPIDKIYNDGIIKLKENKLIKILTSTVHKYNDILLLQLYTGMRIGEVLALSKDCINLKK